MRIVRIYQPGDYSIGQTLELSSSASQHISVVLRMQLQEGLILFCGDNREFTATITAINKKKVTVVIQDVREVNRESPRRIHLAQGISKGERMEWVVQKAVELGVATLTPLLTARCVVKLNKERLAKKHAQWQAIAISACEQSGRNQVPIIELPCFMPDYLQNCQAKMKLVLEPGAEKSWRDYVFPDDDIALLIGPEGGLASDEVNQATAMGFQSLSLGPRILRTETAAITAISVLQAVAGDL